MKTKFDKVVDREILKAQRNFVKDVCNDKKLMKILFKKRKEETCE